MFYICMLSSGRVHLANSGHVYSSDQCMLCSANFLPSLLSGHFDSSRLEGVHRNSFVQWTPSNLATLGTSQSVLTRGVAGEFALGNILWDILKCPEYRGGLISGV